MVKERAYRLQNVYYFPVCLLFLQGESIESKCWIRINSITSGLSWFWYFSLSLSRSLSIPWDANRCLRTGKRVFERRRERLDARLEGSLDWQAALLYHDTSNLICNGRMSSLFDYKYFSSLLNMQRGISENRMDLLGFLVRGRPTSTFTLR